MFSLTFLLLAGPNTANLTLVPNTNEILQRDNLLLLAVLENDSVSAVRLFGEVRRGGQIRYEIRQKDKWVKTMPAGDQIGTLCFFGGDGILLNGKSSYSEREVLHRRSREGAFLFETPGTYQIRAVATMPWGELPSEAVTITVRKRTAADLKKIESLGPGDFMVLALPSLETPMPEKLLELASVGGNIALTIDQCLMAQTACEGGEWKGTRVSKEKNCDWLQNNMDPVAYEHALDHLGSYYVARKHWEGLPRVVRAMKYDSMGRRDLIYHLDLLTRPPTPAKP